MSTLNLVLTGLAAGAVIVFVGVLVNAPSPAEPRRPRGYRPAHRGGPVPWKPDVEAPLPPARALEEQLVSFPVGHPEQARSVEAIFAPAARIVRPVVVEERAEEQPVEHVGADALWSPTQELSLVPDRPIDAQAALEQDIEDEVRREIARIFDPIEAAIARLGHAEQDTCEISFEHLRLAVDAHRAGAL